MSRPLGKKAVFALLILLFLAVNVGGVFTVEMMSDGMHTCPFMGVPALCAMSPVAHLSQWQQTFAALLQDVAVIALLMLLVWAVWYSIPTPVLWHYSRRLSRHRDTGRFFDPLRLAFARGVLHSKAH